MVLSRWSEVMRLVAVLLAGVSLLAATKLRPVEPVTPEARARRIYEELRERGGGGESRDPLTQHGFPEVATEVARQLQELADSKEGDEKQALLELAKALEATGLFSFVTFLTVPRGGTIHYRPIARTDSKTAHSGQNVLPIGIYHVWAERNGIQSSAVGEYEIIAQKLTIKVTELTARKH